MTWGSGPPVQGSPELRRIIALPRRPRPDPERGRALIELMTARHRRTNAACGCARRGRRCMTELRLAQAWALFELAKQGGMLAPIGVGHGKTLLNLLAPLALGIDLALLLVPATLIGSAPDEQNPGGEGLIGEYEHAGDHFNLPSLVVHGADYWGDRGTGRPVLHVISYERLSRPDATAFLNELRPRGIIADEVHKLRHAQSVRTGRVLRHYAAHPRTMFAGWSGSVTDKSLRDYWHLSALALRERSPLPVKAEVVDEWASAIDPSETPAPPGALRELCNPGESVESGFRRRLTETLGVVATDEPAIPAELRISERTPPPLPAEIRRLLRVVRSEHIRPDGEELVDPLAVARTLRELACGFYYRWIFPRGEPVSLIERWLATRKAWRKELRDKLQRAEAHLDSPVLCARAAARAWGEERPLTFEVALANLRAAHGDGSETDAPCPGCGLYACDPEAECPEPIDLEEEARRLVRRFESLPKWKAATWPAWAAIRDQVKPETETIRVDDFLARDAANWAHENRGIVWYASSAFGAWVSELSGLPLHGGGPGAGKRIAEERGDRSIVASLLSHGTGRDGLQYLFHRQLIAQPPSSSTAWEQLLGRLHRTGQEAPIVYADAYRHTPEVEASVDQAMARALYVEQTLGARQKLRVGWTRAEWRE